MSPKLRRYLHWAGTTLAIVGIGFMVVRLWTYSHTINLKHLTTLNWTVILSLCLFYGAISILLAFAWRNLLGLLGVIISPRNAISIYGISQLAKYVPGNIFHLAGRQALGMAQNLPAWTLARSTIMEIVLLMASALVFMALVIPLLLTHVPSSLSNIVFALVSCLLCLFLYLWHGKKLMYAAIYYILFLGFSGLSFYVLFSQIIVYGEMDVSQISFFIGAYVVAWLLGFVTPGAPAGIGIRELVLVFFLGGLTSEDELLLAIAFARAVSVIGDGVFFCIATYLKKPG